MNEEECLHHHSIHCGLVAPLGTFVPSIGRREQREGGRQKGGAREGGNDKEDREHREIGIKYSRALPFNY